MPCHRCTKGLGYQPQIVENSTVFDMHAAQRSCGDHVSTHTRLDLVTRNRRSPRNLGTKEVIDNRRPVERLRGRARGQAKQSLIATNGMLGVMWCVSGEHVTRSQTTSGDFSAYYLPYKPRLAFAHKRSFPFLSPFTPHLNVHNTWRNSYRTPSHYDFQYQ